MIIKGPYPDVAIPETALTRFVLQRAEELADKPALIEGPTGRKITYKELADAISIAAYNLQHRGFKKGDVFGILSSNCPEYAIAFHAVATLGGIVTPINPLYTPYEIAHQLKDSGARFIVTIPTCVEKVAAAAEYAHIDEIFVFGEAPNATPFNSLLVDNGRAEQVAINPREDLVALPYSSGTTGLPKGVMLSHHNLIANVYQFLGPRATPLSSGDNILCFLPLYHIYGLNVMLNPALVLGATLVLMPRFGAPQLTQLLTDE